MHEQELAGLLGKHAGLLVRLAENSGLNACNY